MTNNTNLRLLKIEAKKLIRILDLIDNSNTLNKEDVETIFEDVMDTISKRAIIISKDLESK